MEKNYSDYYYLVFLLCKLMHKKKLQKLIPDQGNPASGTIEKGADGVRVFKFTNADAPLIVSQVKSSCGCTIPKKPEGPILPGESGENSS